MSNINVLRFDLFKLIFEDVLFVSDRHCDVPFIFCSKSAQLLIVDFASESVGDKRIHIGRPQPDSWMEQVCSNRTHFYESFG